MIEIIWQYDPHGIEPPAPATAAEAKQLLESGNARFAALPARLNATVQHTISLSAADLGIGPHPDQAPAQTPFAAALSCADARVPAELLFGQAANSVFTVRVAGNILGPECVGSIEYALAHMPSVRQLIVLGHTGCGAVDATAGAYLTHNVYLGIAALPALRTIVDSLMTVVHTAHSALVHVYGAESAERPGFKSALVELAVCLNAALGAYLLTQWFGARVAAEFAIGYGVYNLVTRQVGLPAAEQLWSPGLAAPPADDEQFATLAKHLAASQWVRQRLEE